MSHINILLDISTNEPIFAHLPSYINVIHLLLDCWSNLSCETVDFSHFFATNLLFIVLCFFLLSCVTKTHRNNVTLHVLLHVPRCAYRVVRTEYPVVNSLDSDVIRITFYVPIIHSIVFQRNYVRRFVHVKLGFLHHGMRDAACGIRYAACGNAYRIQDSICAVSYANFQSAAALQRVNMPPCHSVLKRLQLQKEKDLLVLTLAYKLYPR